MNPLEIPPGVFSTPTTTSMSSRWSDANFVRWISGRMYPVGGWSRLAYADFESDVRAIYNWTDNEGTSYVAYLCEGNLYVDIGGALYDISPVDPIVPPEANLIAGGYGDNLYSFGTFGTPRPDIDPAKAIPPCYTLSNWGEQLLAMTSVDGRLLVWDPVAGPTVPAVVVAGAPINNRTFVVTPERHVMVFGKGGDRRKFGWCDQEDINNWNIASLTSKAGEYDVEPAAPILSACVCNDGVLMFTTLKVYLVQPIGLPYVYNYSEIADGATPLSTASLVPTAIGVMWPSESNFWIYASGTVQPVPCDVWDSMEWSVGRVRFEAASVNISPLSELWWFYPSPDAVVSDRYVIYNYVEGWWSLGKLGRSCGVSASYSTYPIMGAGRSAYQHEYGIGYEGTSDLPYVESYNLNVARGARMSTVDQMIPDVDGDVDQVAISFFLKDDRSRGTERQSSVKPIRPNGFVDVRETGRDFRVRFQSKIATARWTMGQHLLSVVGRGSK